LTFAYFNPLVRSVKWKSQTTDKISHHDAKKRDFGDKITTVIKTFGQALS